MRELIIGGARSGKSRLGVERACASALEVVFIATARASDREMQHRIDLHRAERPAAWRTVEESFHLADAISAHASSETFVLVDCITLWLANVLFSADEQGSFSIDLNRFAHARAALLDCLQACRSPVALITNEVGFGLVPETASGRIFRDEQGRLNQLLAQTCDRVTLVAAGLPLTLKG